MERPRSTPLDPTGYSGAEVARNGGCIVSCVRRTVVCAYILYEHITRLYAYARTPVDGMHI